MGQAVLIAGRSVHKQGRGGRQGLEEGDGAEMAAAGAAGSETEQRYRKGRSRTENAVGSGTGQTRNRHWRKCWKAEAAQGRHKDNLAHDRGKLKK